MADAVTGIPPARTDTDADGDHDMAAAGNNDDTSPAGSNAGAENNDDDAAAGGEARGDDDGEEDEGEGEDEDDDEGIDLRPGAGSPGDSSEEEPTDSEEEREIRKGFIVDEEESARRKRHRKKRRERKRAKAEGEAGSGQGEEGASRKRRKESDEESEALDEDDLELLQENLGIRRNKPKGKLRRLRRRRSVGSDEDAASPPRGLNDIFADDDAAADQVENLFDADEMAGFIEDDSDESRSQAGESDEDRDDARERRKSKQKERERKKAEGAARRKKGGLGNGRLEGVSVEAWQEVAEVFGNGQEYAWAMDDEDEDEPKHKDLKDIFEPSEIASRMLTDEDERIRMTDVPERQQLASVGLPPFDINDEGELTPLIPEEELGAAAVWASDKISRESTASYLLRDPQGNLPPLHDHFLKAIEAVLRFINVDFLEPSHIFHHRIDYLFHAPPGEQQTLLLDEHDLWKLAGLSIKYRAFMARRKEFLDQFRPLGMTDLHLEDVLDQAASVEDMMDALGWLALRYGDRLQEAKQGGLEGAAGAIGEDGLPVPPAEAPPAPAAGGPKRMKRAVRDNEYERARKSVVRKFAELVGMSAAELAQDVNGQQKTHFPDDPDKSPLELADEYVVEPDFPDRTRVIDGALTLLVTDLGHEPILRKEARRYIRDFGVVNVRPTAAGQSKIDRLNPFYAFKYLKNKPFGEFTRSPQWMQILAAEAEGLVQAEITLPEQAHEKFIGDLQRVYLSDFSSTIADEWNALRSKILERASAEHLLPQATVWARNVLKEESEDVIGYACARKLEERVDAAPYIRADETMEPGQTPSVLAISSGRGDPKRDSVVGIFLDTDGHFREHIKIDNLFDPEESQRQAFTDLLKRRRPQVVVVGGYTPATTQLMDNFRNFAARVTEEMLEEGVEDDSEQDEGFPPSEVAGRKANRAAFESTYVHDDVARIYQNSTRAALEFPDLSTLSKYCVGLARYAQSPLNEYAALGQDLGALSYDVNQKYLAKDKVDKWLERALIAVTNRVGVDINRCVRSAYYAHLLPFVSGLGPRKAEALLKKINGIGGTLSTRGGLVLHGLTTKNIFVNVAGFLRIRQDDLDADLGRDAENSEDPDVLDDTRIHPEDYDVARKMAADAMDLDEEDLEGAPPSKAVADLLADDVSKLNDLALDEFAAELTKVMNAPKRFALYKIREELMRPFGERRNPFRGPTAEERFTMWTGETRRTLDGGFIIPVRVIRVSQDEAVLVRLDCGIDGIVPADHRTDGQVHTRLTPGQTLQAMVMEVNYDSLRVELTTRETILQAGDMARRAVATDAWFDEGAAHADQQLAVKSQQKNASGRAKRVIKHPNFQDISAGRAEEFLAGMQRGDCVIRPSSREDHLAVTWKVDEGIYQHLAVHELDKPNEYSLGMQLRVSDRHRYSDLDELIDAHVKQMARKVTELTLNDRFKGTQESLDKFLATWTIANPGRSIYAFGWNSDRKKAGQVVLGFKTSEKTATSHWDVTIMPDGYMLKGQVHGSVQELINAFKIAYQYSMQNGPRAPPPGVSGRTPGYPATAGSRTPNVGLQQGRATPMNGPPQGGATPGGYGGATPGGGYGGPPGGGGMPGGYGGGYYAGGRTPMNAYSGGRTPMAGPGPGAYSGGRTPMGGPGPGAYGGGRTPMPGQGPGGYGGPPPPGMGSGRTPLHPSYR